MMIDTFREKIEAYGHTSSRIRMVSNFLMLPFKARRCGFKVLGANYFKNLEFCTWVKLLIRCEGRKKTFLGAWSSKFTFQGYFLRHLLVAMLYPNEEKLGREKKERDSGNKWWEWDEKVKRSSWITAMPLFLRIICP